jgi:uncharacterized protein
VKRLEKYAVRISGLGDGNHDFTFDIDGKFFTYFEQSGIEHGSVHVAILLEKKKGIMALHFHLTGEVEVICDRCLGSFMNPVDTRSTIYLKTGENPGEIEDNVIVIGREDYELDVSHLIYEFAVLALPIQRIHPAGKNGVSACDPEMIRKLEEYRSEKHNREDIPDPRWDALKDMIEKNS